MLRRIYPSDGTREMDAALAQPYCDQDHVAPAREELKGATGGFSYGRELPRLRLKEGSRIGPYEILALLGAGGMGEVYRARDTRLARLVAIKVLHSRKDHDLETHRRFEREARAISSLSHPHICSLYDVGRQDEIDFLVMEYLEGETLADRLLKGALPVDLVLRFAIQIAGALARAHAQGVVHRDLKPANIMLTKSGTKLLDFGLAKFHEQPEQQSNVSATALTQEGVVLGTVQYMAPEQLEARQSDARADIFAFGAVVFEMATGRKAFDEESPAALIGAILHSQPPRVSMLRPAVPPALDHVVERCLAKDRDERWLTAHDLAIELNWIADRGSAAWTRTPIDVRPRKQRRLIVTSLLLLAAFLLALDLSHRRSANLRATRFTISAPEKTSFSGSLAISPDGRLLAFVATAADGKKLLWVRQFDAFAARPLAGTENAAYPFWSPDSSWIGFFAGGKLKKIRVEDGLPQVLCDASDGRGGTWSRDDVVVFAPQPGAVLHRVAASGGKATPATKLDPSSQETSHMWPHFLPDGQQFVYLARAAQRNQSAIYVQSIDTNDRKYLLKANSNAMYASPGYLLFWRDGALMAQRFDLRQTQVTGDPFPIAQQVRYYAAIDFAYFAAAPNNVLIYRASGNPKTQLVWFDRQGKRIGPASAEGEFDSMWLSPDGKRVAAAGPDPQERTLDIWLLDLSRGNPLRFTFDASDDAFPVWSPDGRSIVYASNRDGLYNLYKRDASGAADEVVVLKSHARKYPTDLSRDGRFLIYITEDPKTKWDLWVLLLAGHHKPVPVLRTDFDELQGQFSPDRRWIAYASDESGSFEVYVQTFPVSHNKWKISNGGGADPVWRQDGRELFYLSPDKKLMAVAVQTNSSTFVPDRPRALFETRVTGLTDARNHYVVTSDGQRFLVNTIVQEATSAPINVVLNWSADLPGVTGW